MVCDVKTVRQVGDKHYIFVDNIKQSGPYDSNALAWRKLEKLEGEAVNAAEQRKMWSQKEWLKSE